MASRLTQGIVAVVFFTIGAAAQNAGIDQAGQLHGADSPGALVYRDKCAVCHDNPGASRAPSSAALQQMTADSVLRTLESGIMKPQGDALTAADRRAVAEYLGKANDAAIAATRCAGDRPFTPFTTSGPSWNGWSADLANTRFQPADRAGLTAADVPRLKLKWAFAFPNTTVANGSPTIAGGRIFVGSPNRYVYALDARSGCQHWAFRADASVRTAISVGAVGDASVAFFGDGSAQAYALDAATGALRWKVKVDDHARSRIVGSPVLYDGTLLVPVTAAEEGFAPNSDYECCTARGSLVALDAGTGRQIWKTYTIDEPARRTGKTAAGTTTWGPSGASIWSAPTIDPERKLVYVGTGDNFSAPATTTSDAILAFDLATGALRWSKQVTAGDMWNNACISVSRANCPESAGPDADIASPPILARLENGRQVLLVSQKSGMTYALDPDDRGKLLWERRVGRGGVVGGIQFGSAFDGTKMYVAVSDMGFVSETIPVGARLVIDPKSGGGFHAIDAATGQVAWSVAPPRCAADRPTCSPAQSAAVTAIRGVAFAGSVDGHLRAYAADDGTVIWDFDTAREFVSVNGVRANGGSMNGPGPTIAGGMLFVSSGYGMGMAGNALLAFSVEGR